MNKNIIDLFHLYKKINYYYNRTSPVKVGRYYIQNIDPNLITLRSEKYKIKEIPINKFKKEALINKINELPDNPEDFIKLNKPLLYKFLIFLNLYEENKQKIEEYKNNNSNNYKIDKAFNKLKRYENFYFRKLYSIYNLFEEYINKINQNSLANTLTKIFNIPFHKAEIDCYEYRPKLICYSFDKMEFVNKYKNKLQLYFRYDGGVVIDLYFVTLSEKIYYSFELIQKILNLLN